MNDVASFLDRADGLIDQIGYWPTLGFAVACIAATQSKGLIDAVLTHRREAKKNQREDDRKDRVLMASIEAKRRKDERKRAHSKHN